MGNEMSKKGNQQAPSSGPPADSAPLQPSTSSGNETRIEETRQKLIERRRAKKAAKLMAFENRTSTDGTASNSAPTQPSTLSDHDWLQVKQMTIFQTFKTKMAYFEQLIASPHRFGTSSGESSEHEIRQETIIGQFMENIEQMNRFYGRLISSHYPGFSSTKLKIDTANFYASLTGTSQPRGPSESKNSLEPEKEGKEAPNPGSQPGPPSDSATAQPSTSSGDEDSFEHQIRKMDMNELVKVKTDVLELLITSTDCSSDRKDRLKTMLEQVNAAMNRLSPNHGISWIENQLEGLDRHQRTLNEVVPSMARLNVSDQESSSPNGSPSDSEQPPATRKEE